MTTPTTARATFASGCFWCTEAVFLDVRGVVAVTSGYAGGRVDSPTYEQVCSGRTGHAEAVDIEFDPAVVSYEQLLKIFFATHNPTQLNRQGNDIGTQYRSAIFTHSPEQQDTATRVKQELESQKLFDAPLVTEITPFTNFFAAEDYHQNYFAKNPLQPYCQAIVSPKLAKFRTTFSSLLKSSSSS